MLLAHKLMRAWVYSIFSLHGLFHARLPVSELKRAVCWRRMCERIATLNNLEILAINGICDADAALLHFAALSRLSRLSIASASHLSTSALARLTALTALAVADAQSWVGCRMSLLHAQH